MGKAPMGAGAGGVRTRTKGCGAGAEAAGAHVGCLAREQREGVQGRERTGRKRRKGQAKEGSGSMKRKQAGRAQVSRW